MLSTVQLEQLNILIASATKEELLWMSGYINGFIQKGLLDTTVTALTPTLLTESNKKITILFGTETGNSKKLANQLAIKAKELKLQPKVVGMDQYRVTDFIKEKLVLIIISTQGEGDPPEASKSFFDYLHTNTIEINQLHYSVLALGDTSYPLFCKAGDDIDIRLAELGAKRIMPIEKCDVDFEAVANKWIDTILNQLTGGNQVEASLPTLQLEKSVTTEVVTKKSSGKAIHTGKIGTNIVLTGNGSTKEIRHIEIIGEEPFPFIAGDSIGIVPPNPDGIVKAILTYLPFDTNQSIEYKGESYSMIDLLTHQLNIIQFTDRIIKKYGEIIGEAITETKVGLLELLRKYMIPDEQQFTAILQSLNTTSPRLYNIASSPLAHNGEVHITVLKDVFELEGFQNIGLCTGYLSGLEADAPIKFFIQTNKRYRLPAENTDIIMIGPSTGIAPFRCFLAERETTNATGKNWLFFAEENFQTDFLYQTELQQWVETGVLTKLNVAFTNQGNSLPNKIIEQSETLFQWLQRGAYLYLCGEKTPMSIEVEKALLTALQVGGQLKEDAAKSYFEQLKQDGRYLKDVY